MGGFELLATRLLVFIWNGAVGPREDGCGGVDCGDICLGTVVCQ